jgi:hypothetical protein
MGKNITLNKKELLGRLEEIPYKPGDKSEGDVLEEMSLARSLLKLAGIDHEREYSLCRSVAEKLLEKVPEPDELEIEPD